MSLQDWQDLISNTHDFSKRDYGWSDPITYYRGRIKSVTIEDSKVVITLKWRAKRDLKKNTWVHDGDEIKIIIDPINSPPLKSTYGMISFTLGNGETGTILPPASNIDEPNKKPSKI